MELRNKRIYIISQEKWGKMFLSKHHYAVELGKEGNQVFFFNHPDSKRVLKRGEIIISKTPFLNVFVINHRYLLPLYFINFKLKSKLVYNILLRLHLKKISKLTGAPDMVWSFDLTDYIPLKCFPNQCLKIFLPVDESVWQDSINAAASAKVIISVTNEILAKYKRYNVPKAFINHGVSEIFINQDYPEKADKVIRVGYSGTILRPDIDRTTLLTIIKQNTNCLFEFWGECDYNDSYLELKENKEEGTEQFVSTLKSLNNVTLHGVVTSEKLAAGLKQMDAFLICYNIKIEQSHGTNSHKILEYLGTGKTVVANNISTYYKTFPGLIEMIESRENNNELPALFSKVINNLSEHNSIIKMKNRIDFAKGFTYKNQVKRIADFLSVNE